MARAIFASKKRMITFIIMFLFYFNDLNVYLCHVISSLTMIAMIVIVFPSTWSGLPSPPPSSTQPLCSKSKKFQQRPPTGCKVTPMIIPSFSLLWLQCFTETFSIPLCFGIYVLRWIIINCHFVVSFIQEATRSMVLRGVRCSIIGWWHLCVLLVKHVSIDQAVMMSCAVCTFYA